MPRYTFPSSETLCAICGAEVDRKVPVASEVWSDHERRYYLCDKHLREHIERGTMGLLRAIIERLRLCGYKVDVQIDGVIF